QGKADLLFVGINPRRSDTNLDLHDWLMKSPENFERLANNTTARGERYVAINGKEEHYHCHMIVVEGVFGPGTIFETKAAVTELYLCANESGSALLKKGRSPCASQYLSRCVKIVQPSVVVAVGF